MRARYDGFNEPGDVAKAIRCALSDTEISISGVVLAVDDGRVAAV
jgi:hypothetical protein